MPDVETVWLQVLEALAPGGGLRSHAVRDPSKVAAAAERRAVQEREGADFRNPHPRARCLDPAPLRGEQPQGRIPDLLRPPRYGTPWL